MSYEVFVELDDLEVEVDEVDNSASAPGPSRPKRPRQNRFYKKDWETDKSLGGSITIDPVTKDRPYCKHCKKSFENRLSILKTHVQGKNHKKNANAAQPQEEEIVVVEAQPQEEIRPASYVEARLAMFTACHGKVSHSDCLVKTTKSCAPDSEPLMSATLCPTKCRAIIVNALAPYCDTLMKADIRDGIFSLFIDEGTDISTSKYLGIAINYHSRRKPVLRSCYHSLKMLESFTGVSMAEAVKQTVTGFGLNMTDMVGICSDGAKSMVGDTLGMGAVLKREYPHIIHIHCANHGIQNASSKAALATLPGQVGDVISSTYNWFCSSKRKKDFQRHYKLLHDGEVPLNLIALSDTRWLAIYYSAKRVLDYWSELGEFFNQVPPSHTGVERRLATLYASSKIKALLGYLTFILEKVQKVDQLFQSKACEPILLDYGMMNLLKELKFIIYHPSACHMLLE